MSTHLHRFLLLVLLNLLLFAALAHAERLAPPLTEQARTGAAGRETVVLESIKRKTVAADGNWDSQRYFSIRIGDQAAARDYGRIVLSYNSYEDELELEYANILSPDGVLKPLAKDAVQTRVD